MNKLARDILYTYVEDNSKEVIWHDTYYIIHNGRDSDYYCWEHANEIATQIGLATQDIRYDENPESDITLLCGHPDCNKLLDHFPSSDLSKEKLRYWIEDLEWPPSSHDCAVMSNIMRARHDYVEPYVDNLLDIVFERVNQETRRLSTLEN